MSFCHGACTNASPMFNVSDLSKYQSVYKTFSFKSGLENTTRVDSFQLAPLPYMTSPSTDSLATELIMIAPSAEFHWSLG